MSNKLENKDQINLIGFLGLIWDKKRTVVWSVFIVMFLGLVFALTQPEEYKVTSTFISEVNGSNTGISGGLSGLASLAGIDVQGQSSKGFNPGLYKNVANSIPFLYEVMYQEFDFEELGSISLYEFFLYHRKSGLLEKLMSVPFEIIRFFKGGEQEIETTVFDKGMLKLTRNEHYLVEILMERIEVTMDWELNIVSIEVEMQDPKVAAQIGVHTADYITKYVIDYSIAKSKSQLEFVEGQYLEKKKVFEDVQDRLAMFRDQNRNVTTARAQAEEQKLVSEFNLAFNVYNQLAQQMEMIKLQINEDEPVFTIIDPIVVPLEPYRPRKFMILFLSFVIGVFFAFFLTAYPLIKAL